ncbi:NinE family protein [Escherichia coli]
MAWSLAGCRKLEVCVYLPTKRSRNKRKPIPKESDVKTFNYTAHLWDI